MPFFQPANSKKITLDELMALNEEIIALVRAGVPLELGLSELGEDRAAAFGRAGTQIAARLNQGESLPEAMSHPELGLPRSYRVIVEAGLRAGRLTAALEGVASFGMKMAELRRRIGLALVYPLIVLLLAYGLFLLMCTHSAPRMRWAFENLGIPIGLYHDFAELGELALPWGLLPPLIVVGLIIWWRRSGDRGFLSDDGPSILCPAFRRKITTYYRSAQFADLLALLIEQNVPMPEAIVLAGETTGDPQMQNAARAIAEATTRGFAVPGNSSPGYAGFPPFLHWLMTRQDEQGGLVSALRAAADMYRRRAALITEWIKVVFPVIAAVVIGGGATLLYTLTVFWPFAEVLKSFADPFL